ncbi:His/Gly/Thr/Pro-type tRNA ligase C-terminal domain-containing protein [Chengkuizengella sp. SCS-71B]|uniref:His/Gly/Thr/Pro-type tRNA ligase C-terminal domain-containing protein n=1 Tax=Chengkuizengella sp. SCS-71B TaxID=3115290 RepID=UPI0032C24187
MIPINTQKESLLVATSLRKQGFKVEFEMGNKKIGKALDKANKGKVHNVIIIGEDEVRNNEFIIKDMITGEENRQSFVYNKL